MRCPRCLKECKVDQIQLAVVGEGFRICHHDGERIGGHEVWRPSTVQLLAFTAARNVALFHRDKAKAWAPPALQALVYVLFFPQPRWAWLFFVGLLLFSVGKAVQEQRRFREAKRAMDEVLSRMERAGTPLTESGSTGGPPMDGAVADPP